MTVQTAAIIEAQFAPAALGNVYTSTGVKTMIDKFTATNVAAAPITFQICLVPSGGAGAVSNIVLVARTLLVGETYTCPEAVGHVLEAGDAIEVVAGAVSSIVIRASGRKVS